MATVSTSRGPGLCTDSAQLFERYGEQIRRYCLARLRDREEAADAAQSTFLRVHRALEGGVVPQFESAWLYKIAHNVCLSRLEASGRRARLETPHDLDGLDEALLAAPETERDAVAGLAEALEALPLNLRQAILLREWQGLSYGEIAAAMETTVPAVETLLYRARRQLALALGQPARAGRAVSGLLWLPGLRSLLRRGCGQLGTLSGASAKTVAGVAAVTLGGSGLGAAVVVADLSSPPRPARRPAAASAVVAPVGGSLVSVRGRLGDPAATFATVARTRRVGVEGAVGSTAEERGAAIATEAATSAAARPAATGAAAAPGAVTASLVDTPTAPTTAATSTASPQVPTVPTPLESAPSVPPLPPSLGGVPEVPTPPAVPAVPAVPSVPSPPSLPAVPTVPAVTAPPLPVTSSVVVPGG